MALGTGHGSTLGFTTGAYSLAVREMTLQNEDSAQVDATHLGTTGTRDYVPADLAELADFNVEILFDSESADGLPPLNVQDTITVTFKLQVGEVAPATLVGPGWIRSRQWPNLQTNEVMASTLIIQWAEDPVWTAATNA